MRQLLLDASTLTVKQVAEPLLVEDAILVSVHYSFVSSGTEGAAIANSARSLFSNIPEKFTKVITALAQHGIRGTKALIKERVKGGLFQQLGYSCSGRVVAVGKKVTQFRVGDFVACAGAGVANHADFVCVPVNLAVKIPHEQLVQACSITTIGSIALQGIRRAQLQIGEIVCIQGLGLLGQLSVQLARLAGCRVIGIDLIPERLEIARRLGAEAVFLADSPTLISDIEFMTGHQGVDCTIITAASKSDSLVQQAMQVTRRKGKVVLVGDVGLHLSRDPLYKKEIDFLISCSYGPGRYDATYERDGVDYPYAYVRWTENRNMQAIVNLIEQEKLDLAPLITQCCDIAHAQEGYKKLQTQSGLGILVSYVPKNEKLRYISESNGHDVLRQKIVRFVPARATNLRVGVIGAGGFAKVMLLPLLERIKNVSVSAVVDANITAALTTARLYGAEHVFTDDRELFEKDVVDAVIIASPHIYHGPQILRALAHGKAVFAEKPMATTREQLAHLSDLLEINKQAPLCVDFNRSFSPFMQKIKKAVAQRSSPFMAYYRMNAGFIPNDHWTQTAVGGGRLIGEGCHIFDLFCYLTDARPTSVSVDAICPQQNSIGLTDNATVQITFSDGSVCVLLYTALGHANAGKERMEIFFDGKTIVMENYQELVGYGLPASFSQKLVRADKGHEALVNQFFGALRSDNFVAPIPFQRLFDVSNIAIAATELAQIGGGQVTVD